MIKDIIEDEDFLKLVTKQIEGQINFIVERNIKFSVIANIKAITFTPELPDDIYKQFDGQFTLFLLANYTLSTARIENSILSFEAGFGKDNFGSIVEIPLSSIFQIMIDNTILFTNPSATVEKFISQNDQKQRSKNALKFKK